MKLYHGTDREFDKFSNEYIGSSEGSAKRGHGINLAQDRSVSEYYIERTNAEKGYLLTVSVPEMDEFIDLDDSILKLPHPVEDTLYSFTLKYLGEDIYNGLEEARYDEGVNYNYSEERAEDMFSRVILNSNDHEAWEELEEFSPDYDWSETKALLDKVSLQLDVLDSGKDFYEGMVANGKALSIDEAEICKFLDHLGISGTFGSEPINSESQELDTKSFVVFSESKAQIVDREVIMSNDNQLDYDDDDMTFSM